jgi:CRISPR-associated protein Csb2
MALAKTRKGAVETLFSGHEPDGAKENSGRHRHVFLAGADINCDGYLDELIVAAPLGLRPLSSAGTSRNSRVRPHSHVARNRACRSSWGHQAWLADYPRLGGALFGPSRAWESSTPYSPTRHARRGDSLTDAIVRDVIAECVRRGLPRPEVEILESGAGMNGGAGLEARLRLRFALAVDGPILLGRDSHAGGALFIAMPMSGISTVHKTPDQAASSSLRLTRQNHSPVLREKSPSGSRSSCPP